MDKINQNNIIRVNKAAHHFVMLDKRFLNNPVLSWKSKGMLAYLLSKPDDWTVRRGDLIKKSIDGKSSVDSALKELKEFGYIRHDQIRGSDGRIEKHLYTIYEHPQNLPQSDNQKVDVLPQSDYQEVDNPEVDNPEVDNRNLNNIDYTEKDLNKNDNNKIDSLIGPPPPINTPSKNNNGGAGGKIQNEKKEALKSFLNSIDWTGCQDEVLNYYDDNPARVNDWIEKTKNKKGLTNPAGFLLKNLRSGLYPSKIKNFRYSLEEDLKRIGVNLEDYQ